MSLLLNRSFFDFSPFHKFNIGIELQKKLVKLKIEISGCYNQGSHQKGQATWWGLDWHLDIEGNLTNVDEDFGLYSTRAIAKRANEVITGHDFAQNPLFLYVAFQSVHSGNNDDPIQVPAETEYKYKVKKTGQTDVFVQFLNTECTTIA